MKEIPNKATKGERSSIPIFGITLRIGERIGSVTEYINMTIGFLVRDD